jgi:hypothetical protein
MPAADGCASFPGVVDSPMTDELKGGFDVHHGAIPPPE